MVAALRPFPYSRLPGSAMKNNDSGCHSPLVFEVAHDVFVFAAYKREITGHLVNVIRAEENAAYGFEGKNGVGVVQAYQVYFFNAGNLIAKVGVEVQKLFG